MKCKKRISMLLAAVVFTAGLPGVVAEETAENLLSNGGFESSLFGTGDWKFVNTGNWYNEGVAALDTTQHHSGSYSIKLNEGTAGQRVNLTAGVSYKLTAYVKADTEVNYPIIGFYDGTQTWPASNDYAAATESISTTSDWTEITVDFNCTATQDYIIGMLVWANGAAATNVYFDDITLVETEYDSKGIVNGNFSDGTNGWTISGDGTATADDGALTASGTVRVSQTVTGLENGTYNLTATAYTSDVAESGVSYLYAKTTGHTMSSTSIQESSSGQSIVVPNIIVEDGTCDIGLYLDSSAAVTLDNLSLTETESTRVPFYKGGEISKLTYVEDNGGKFYRADGTQADALQIMAENGFNMARIRLLDDPGKGHGDGDYYLPAGYMTEEDCLDLARRAKDKGMAIEFTIAYSDYWVDGATQVVPYAWQQEITELGITGAANLVSYFETKIYDYTTDIMQKLIDQGTCPEYVSIGNEIQVGILFGLWQSNNGLYNNATYLARLLNAGAKAVRETSPETKIILHSDNGGLVSKRTTFINAIKNVDFDVIGVSYYPYYNSSVSIDNVVSEFNTFINTYDKDVIIMETGYNWNELRGDGWEGQLENSGYYQDIYGESQEGQRAFLTELYSKLKQVAGGRCIGDLYWDPVMIYDGGKYKIGWAISESGNYTQGNVVSNSTIFDFNGKAVAGQLAMKYNTDANDKLNITGKITSGGKAVTEKEVSFTVNGSQYNVTTDKFGEYIVSVPYPSSENLSISLKGSSAAYNEDAVYDGVLMSGINFTDFDTSTTPDPTPTATTEPTATPTAPPTATPTALPTATPTALPTATPTALPTATPTALPTATPTALPTATPTALPTATPTATPTAPPDLPTEDPDKAYISDIEAEQEDGIISYNVQYSSGGEEALFFVALYDEDGVLIGCRINESSASFAAVNVTESAYTVKAFLWKTEDLVPLCAPKEISVLISGG